MLYKVFSSSKSVTSHIPVCHQDWLEKPFLCTCVIGSILHHKITRPLLALQKESCKCKTTWSPFPGVPAPSITIDCQGSARFPEGITTHCYTITTHLYSFTSINNAFFTVESRCCRHVVFRLDLLVSDWSELLWPVWVRCKFFRDLSCLLGFCQVCLGTFPPRGWKDMYPLFANRRDG